MRPLSDTCPKPLLKVKGRPLLFWHLEALQQAGVHAVVVNAAWLEEQMVEACANCPIEGLHVHMSLEMSDHGQALETAGGVRKALPCLEKTFWLVSGDIHAPGFIFSEQERLAFTQSPALAKIWLVPNPIYHTQGDFTLNESTGLVGLPVLENHAAKHQTFTYANLALIKKELCAHLPVGQNAPLGPLLKDAAKAGLLQGELYQGVWHNVGTPQDLKGLNE